MTEIEGIRERLGAGVPAMTILIHAKPRQQPDYRTGFEQRGDDLAYLLGEVERVTHQRDALQALEGGWTAQQVADYLATAAKACVVLEHERDEALAARDKARARVQVLEAWHTERDDADLVARAEVERLTRELAQEREHLSQATIAYGAQDERDAEERARLREEVEQLRALRDEVRALRPQVGRLGEWAHREDECPAGNDEQDEVCVCGMYEDNRTLDALRQLFAKA